MCARVTETIWYVSDCCQLNCDSESSRTAPWALPPFVFFPVLRASACAPNNKWISKIVVAIFFSLSLPTALREPILPG